MNLNMYNSSIIYNYIQGKKKQLSIVSMETMIDLQSQLVSSTVSEI